MSSHALRPMLVTDSDVDPSEPSARRGRAVVADQPLSNAALVAQFRQQDPNAFAELFRRHRNLVYAVCFGRLRHHHDAEDLTQETFRRLAASIDRWDPRRPLEPWLVRIAGNRCRTFLSRQRREITGADWNETVAVTPPVADQTVVSDEIEIAIRSLPIAMQTAFLRIHRDGWSYEQASEHLGHPIGTIKTWVHRARLRLIDQLRPQRKCSAEASPANEVLYEST
jgi:RNA polymerase sigma factor (sigma-70 family)